MTTAHRIARIAYGAAGLALVALIGAGCATSTPEHYYLRRAPIRVAVVPSLNKTDHPEAPVVFNKACEEALRERGFEVVSADQVVSYAAARGMLLRELPGRKPSEIGADLKADFLLYSDIDTWAQKYIVVKSATVVSGSSCIYETGTDALVWRQAWRLQRESGDGGGGLAGLIANAAVSAILNSATDACAMLGSQAARMTVGTLPRPGSPPPR
jgi:hypothetical protein